MENDELHREDEPAIEDASGYTAWFINGKQIDIKGIMDLSLAKVDVPSDWISTVVGEPYLVKEKLFSYFKVPSLNLSDPTLFEYTKPQGYGLLVKFLENKHQAPVVISNGAKQCIAALFYALKNQGINNINLSTPYWSLFPPLIKMCGLGLAQDYSAAKLLVHPNNPDGRIFSEKQISEEEFYHKYVIHDAAYYNPIYMTRKDCKRVFGNVQVFTCSKLFGLSQLRVGYTVFHNTELYNHVMKYMESMTVGVSILSQIFALNIFKLMEENPKLARKFEDDCNEHIKLNRVLLSKIDSNILDVDPSQEGMFLWAKCHNFKAFELAKVQVAEGTPFGVPGYVRINIAQPTPKIQEIVERLNNV